MMPARRAPAGALAADATDLDRGPAEIAIEVEVEAQIRDSLIDALLRGDEPALSAVPAEQRALAGRLAALGALTERAGDEIANHIARFVVTTERFALAVEQMKTLPEEIAAAPVLLTEICEGLCSIAAIGRDLSRAASPSPPRTAARPSVVPPV